MLKFFLIFAIYSLSVFASSLEISAVHPHKSAYTVTIDVDGVVESKNAEAVSVKREGNIHFIVANSSKISKGDLIATLTNTLADKKIEFLKKRLDSLKDEILIQKQKLKTTQDKNRMGVGSKNIYLSEKLSLLQIQQRYDTTQNEYQILLFKLKNSSVYAKKSGVITDIIEEGSYVTYGSKIATIINQNSLVKLFVDAVDVQSIKNGMRVKLQTDYKTYNATILHVTPKSRDNLIEVIAKADKKLPIDLHVSAKIVLKEAEALAIKKESIVLVQNHPCVYTIDDKNTAHLHFIQIIRDMIDTVIIKNTLPKGAKIALKNAYMLHDNLEVIVK